MGGQHPKSGEHRQYLRLHLGGSVLPRRTGTSTGLSMTTVVPEMMPSFSCRERRVANLLVKGTASFIITKKNLWFYKWTSEIHSDYVDCTNWKYQMVVDCLLSTYIRKIIFTLHFNFLVIQKQLCNLPQVSEGQTGKALTPSAFRRRSKSLGMGVLPVL